LLFKENPNPTFSIEFKKGANNSPIPVEAAIHAGIPPLKAKLNDPHLLKFKQTETVVSAGHGSLFIFKAIVPKVASDSYGTTSQ